MRWRRVDLKRVIEQRFGVDYHERKVGKLLKKIGFSHISARPRHPAKAERTIAAFKKTSRDAERPPRPTARKEADRDLVPGRGPHRPEERPGSPVGETRHTTQAAGRPALRSAYLFGAICPARGVGAALAMPFADTRAMQPHLDEITRNVAGRARRPAARPRRLAYDRQARLPRNITLILLPSRSPELNPVENIWQYLRANWLSNRVFETYDEIIDASCEAWKKLIAVPNNHLHRMRRLGARRSAHDRWYEPPEPLRLALTRGGGSKNIQQLSLPPCSRMRSSTLPTAAISLSIRSWVQVRR